MKLSRLLRPAAWAGLPAVGGAGGWRHQVTAHGALSAHLGGGGGDSVQSRAGEAFDVEPTSVLGLQNTVTLKAAIDAPLPWAQRRPGEGTPGGGARLRPRQPAAITQSWRRSFVLSEPVSRATHWRWEMRLQFGAQRDQLLSSGSKRADQGERY